MKKRPEFYTIPLTAETEEAVNKIHAIHGEISRLSDTLHDLTLRLACYVPKLYNHTPMQARLNNAAFEKACRNA